MLIATRLLAAEGRAGTRQHVVLSVAGIDRLEYGGYYAGKLAQVRRTRSASARLTT